MIGIVHGYGLGGAGSNLWTRETVAALCDNGETVHLMCQEADPERYDFISELWTYDDEGRPELRFRRDPGRPGRCVVHRPALNVLPTYVRPDRPSDYVRSILDLDAPALDEYVARNLRALRHITREHGIGAWHVNHTILLSESLRQLQAADGTPFAVMPHGSALEYVVQHDDRMKDVARSALAAADRVFALNQEIRDRLARYFPDLDLDARTRTVRVGVDTERFRPVPRGERRASVERLADALDGRERGRAPGHGRELRALVDAPLPGAPPADDSPAAAPSHDAFRQGLAAALDYATGRPDADLEERLRAVDWERARVITFVGRIIPAKGVTALVAAFPLILEAHPDAHLLLVGAGWLREYLEAFTHALARGDGDAAARFLEWADERAQEGARPSGTLFLERLREDGRWDGYVAAAVRDLRPERVLFTGFLEHDLLAHVFPLSDVAVFPSAVAEASPLVVPEAAACGCLPMGTDFAGMRRSLDSLAPRLPESLRDLLRLDPDPRETGLSIARNVDRALDALDAVDPDDDPTEPLRTAAVEEYDWHRIARVVARELAEMEAPGATGAMGATGA